MTSVATISRAPCARAAMIASAPIGPQPVTRTRLPSSDPARLTACSVTAKRLGERRLVDRDVLGHLVALPCSATRLCRNAPWMCGIGMALP